MISTLKWSSKASYRCLTGPTAVISLQVVRQSSSFSAVWRGLRNEDKSGGRRQRAPSRESRVRGESSSNQGAPSRGDARSQYDPQRSSVRPREKPVPVLAGGRKHFKLKKALKKIQEREDEDEGGRKTRSKRFNDPGFSFGKKSLVYQINKGDFKDKINRLVEERRGRAETMERKGASTERPAPRSGNAWDSLDRASSTSGESRARSFKDRPVAAGRHRDAPERRRSAPRSGNAWESLDRVSSTSGGRRPRTFQDGPRAAGRHRDAPSERRPFERRRPSGLSDPRIQMARQELESADEGTRSPPSRQRVYSHDGQRPRSHDDLPVTLPYTTAASQFLFGRWPVTAALKEANRKLYHLYVYEGSNKRDATDSIRSLAEKRGVPVTLVPESKQQLLDSMSKGRPHNGLVLEASPLPQLPLTSLGPVTKDGYTVEIAHQSKEDLAINGSEPFHRWATRSGHKPLVLLLHEVMDPGNLGAILRTARYLGAAAVAITKQTSSPITPTVVKAAAGAAEELTIFSVADPAAFLEASKEAGWNSYVAVAPGSSKNSNRDQSTPEDIAEDDPLKESPCILVLGNEGEGLSRRIISRASHQVTIVREASAGVSSVDSLNVSVAAALLCDAFTKGARKMPRSFEAKLREDAKKARAGEAMF